MSNFATESYFKSGAGVNTSEFVKKTDLGSLKMDVDKLDIGKLDNTSANLSK